MKTYLTTTTFVEKKTCKTAFFQPPKNPRFLPPNPTNRCPIRDPATGGPAGPGPETMRLAELDLEEKALLQDGGGGAHLCYTPIFVYHWENFLPTLKIGIKVCRY